MAEKHVFLNDSVLVKVIPTKPLDLESQTPAMN